MATSWPSVIPIASTQPSGSVEQISAIQSARASMLLAYAEGAYLTAIGQNYGVPRAPQLTSSGDDLYRRIIPVLAWSPKMIKRTTYVLLETLFGSQQSLITAGVRPWRIFEVSVNEIVFEIPANLMATSNENASYLHGWVGYAFNVTGSTANSFTTPGDVRTAAANSLIGAAVFRLYLSGAWTTNTATGITYDATTDTTTVTFASPVIPSGGCPFFVDVTGNGTTTSYRGDYLAPSAYISAFTTAPGVGTTSTISVLGDATKELVANGSVHLSFGASTADVILSVDPTYDPTTNLSTLTITTTISLGLSGLLFRAQEAADGTSPATAPHNDRVYLAGNGLYEVFQYYYDLLVRAAGIIVRLEVVSDYTHTHRSVP